MTNTYDMREAFGDLARELAEARAESVEPVEQSQQAQVPDEALNIVEGIRAELTWGGWRSARSRDWVMDSLSELLSMLTASPAPEHIGDGNEMVGWVSVKDQWPDPTEESRVLGHNGEYAFECEFEDGFWCNIGGEPMTHWMPLPKPPQQEEAER